MPKVKKNLKKKGEAVEGSEAPTNKQSPKLSPKMSPKQSPQVAPDLTAEPKKDVKKAKAKDKKEPQKEEQRETAPVVSDEKKALLTKEAVEAILKGIAKPDSQAKGAFVPPDWNAKFKPALGGYKKFCATQTGKLQVVERGSNYLILKAGDKAPPATDKAVDWKGLLEGAWSAYCKATTKNDRNIESFTASIASGVKKTAAEDASKSSPKMSAKASPAEAGAEAAVRLLKRKAKAAEATEDAPKEAPAPMKKKAKRKA